MTVHTFDESLADGKHYEDVLDDYFERAYYVTHATRDQERLGIDRYFEHRRTGTRYSVEYKTDHQTISTGYVFMETVSVDGAGKRGWAYTSTAQVLVYYIPSLQRAYRADMTAIKRSMVLWFAYNERATWTRSRDGEKYRTLGRLVPLSVFAEACVQVHHIPVTGVASGEQMADNG